MRQYVETNDEPAVSGSGTEHKAEQTNPHLNWTVPDGWIERKGGGLRLATFIIGNEKSRIFCTLVSLKGDGGGIRANIRRWLGQLNLSSELTEETDLTRFISNQKKIETSGGLTGLFVDFTSLTGSPERESMMVTVFQLSDQSVFVKMLDKESILIRNREDYLKLARSLAIVKGESVEKN